MLQRSYAMFNAEQLEGIDPWQGQIEELVAELTSVFVAGQLGFRLAFDSVDDKFTERHAA